jgi:hypothetical protein
MARSQHGAAQAWSGLDLLRADGERDPRLSSQGTSSDEDETIDPARGKSMLRRGAYPRVLQLIPAKLIRARGIGVKGAK